MKLLKNVLFFAGFMLIVPAVHAGYLGISIGDTEYQTKAFDAPFDDGLQASANSVGLVYGLELSDIFALEFGYADYGKASGEVYRESGPFPGDPAITYQYSENAQINVTALQFSGVMNLQVNDFLAFQATVGIEKWESEISWTFDYQDTAGNNVSDVISDAGDGNTNPFYGAGLVFTLSESIRFAVVYDVHELNTDLQITTAELKQTRAKLTFNL